MTGAYYCYISNYISYTLKTVKKDWKVATVYKENENDLDKQQNKLVGKVTDGKGKGKRGFLQRLVVITPLKRSGIWHAWW